MDTKRSYDHDVNDALDINSLTKKLIMNHSKKHPVFFQFPWSTDVHELMDFLSDDIQQGRFSVRVGEVSHSAKPIMMDDGEVSYGMDGLVVLSGELVNSAGDAQEFEFKVDTDLFFAALVNPDVEVPEAE